MRFKIAMTLTAIVALATLAAACGDPDSDAGDGADPTRTPSTRPATSTPPAAGDSGDTPVASTPDDDGDSTPVATATPAAVPAVPPDRVLADAPIDAVEVLILESFPPQYNLHITSGLPSGCAEFHSVTFTRDATTIDVHVQNTMPADQNTACTQIYGMHETTLSLGSDFVSGTTYTVKVNDHVTQFTAQ